jgi:hypothetical protein
LPIFPFQDLPEHNKQLPTTRKEKGGIRNKEKHKSIDTNKLIESNTAKKFLKKISIFG